MKEILFRGKRVDNGEWAYGDFAKPCNIVWEANGFDEVLQHEGIVCYDEQVIPETVGQYTGLNDKNGNKIFEGDILKIISSTKNGEREDSSIVMSNKDTGGYRLKVLHKSKYKRISKFSNNNLWCYKAEIIGNTHDNQELLEENK